MTIKMTIKMCDVASYQAETELKADEKVNLILWLEWYRKNYLV